jgi:hypothetical protein
MDVVCHGTDIAVLLGRESRSRRCSSIVSAQQEFWISRSSTQASDMTGEHGETPPNSRSLRSDMERVTLRVTVTGINYNISIDYNVR